MGLFDKEKLTEMANKAKETVKESWDEAKAEQERRCLLYTSRCV